MDVNTLTFIYDHAGLRSNRCSENIHLHAVIFVVVSFVLMNINIWENRVVVSPH
jgi:hypothetical protein